MKSSQGPVKFVIGCWAHPGTTAVYTEEKNVRVTMECEAPKRRTLKSTDMVPRVLQWERQKRCYNLEKKKRAQVVILHFKWIFVFGKRRWRQEKTRERSNLIVLIFFQNCIFWAYFKKKNQHIHLLVHGHSSWSTFGLHLVRDPKAL